MKQVLIQGGGAVVAEVPAPTVGARNILVKVEYSCISVGTEMAGVRMSGMPLYRRALKQPENVKRVLAMVAEQGLRRTLKRVSGKLTSGSPTGYSAAGHVVAVGDEVAGFAVGERVACAGAGIANHAEWIDVPVNLAVKLPDEISTRDASTVTLGAIALQGVRRASPTLGETGVVVGLGILGQLTAQMLSSSGCRVVGVDPDSGRVAAALSSGMDIGVSLADENYVDTVYRCTDGVGADFVVITAAAASSQVVSDAMKACRRKGRVVLVGDVGLNLDRSDFYRKELDVLISCSYGPGRYDPEYEDFGRDYPLPYVRWTENRNMQAYLDLLASRHVLLDDLRSADFPVAEASSAYECLKSGHERPLLVFLSYPEVSSNAGRRVDLRAATPLNGQIEVALVGASSFAQGVHLPNLVALRKSYRLRSVMSRTGATAVAVAKQYEADFCSTDFEEVLRDSRSNLVMIATRHDLHGSLALKALQAGKHVFVEKPLTIRQEELEAISDFYRDHSDAPLLMVGFNRRFSPAIRHVQSLLQRRTGPMMVLYRMNAGFIPSDHWVHGPEGGGRNLGEACHIYDLFVALRGNADVVSVQACAITPTGGRLLRNDNFVATVKFEDGSVCTLCYTALGNKDVPKESMDVYFDGKVISMLDYRQVTVHGAGLSPWSSQSIQKGQREELEALADALCAGHAWPIPLDQQLCATRIAFEVERQLLDAPGLVAGRAS